jgi:hypothetical protein
MESRWDSVVVAADVSVEKVQFNGAHFRRDIAGEGDTVTHVAYGRNGSHNKPDVFLLSHHKDEHAIFFDSISSSFGMRLVARVL